MPLGRREPKYLRGSRSDGPPTSDRGSLSAAHHPCRANLLSWETGRFPTHRELQTVCRSVAALDFLARCRFLRRREVAVKSRAPTVRKVSPPPRRCLGGSLALHVQNRRNWLFGFSGGAQTASVGRGWAVGGSAWQGFGSRRPKTLGLCPKPHHLLKKVDENFPPPLGTAWSQRLPRAVRSLRFPITA